VSQKSLASGYILYMGNKCTEVTVTIGADLLTTVEKGGSTCSDTIITKFSFLSLFFTEKASILGYFDFGAKNIQLLTAMIM